MRPFKLQTCIRVVSSTMALIVVCAAVAVGAGRDLHSTNKSAIALYKDGMSLANQEKFDQALEKLKAAIDMDPAFLEAHLRYMDAFRSVGRGEEVATMYKNMLDKNPNSPMYNFLYGRTISDLTAKRAAFRKALSLDPTYYYAQYGIGGSFMLEGRLDEAIVALNKALEMKPGMQDALRLQGSIYMDKGMPLQARSVFEQALSADSTDAQLMMGLGQAFSQLERYESAEKTFRKAVALHPEESEFYYYIGLVCEMSGRPADALASFQKFAREAPDHELAPAVRRMIERLKQ